MKKKYVRSLLLFFLFISLQQIAYSQAVSWKVNPLNSNWNDVNNWSTGVVPTSVSVVTIPTTSIHPIINVGGPIQISDLTVSDTLDLGIVGNFTITNNLTISAGSKLKFGTQANSVILNSSTSTLAAAGTIDMSSPFAHNLILKGATNSCTTFLTSNNGSTVTYNGTSAAGVFVSTNYQNLVINSTSSTSVAGAGAVTVNGTFNIIAGTFSLGASSRTLTVNGNFTTATGINLGSGTTSKLVLKGMSNSITGAIAATAPLTQAVEYSGPTGQPVLAVTYPCLNIIGSGTETRLLAGNTIVNGTLTISFSTLTFGATAKTVTVTGNLLGNSSGNIDMTLNSNHILSLNGGTNNLSNLTTDANNSTVKYSSATPGQTIFASNAYRIMDLSGAASKSLQGNTNILGSLNFSGNATLNLGSFDLTLAPAATIAGGPFSTSKMIVGNGLTTGGKLVKIVNAATDLTTGVFPIGTPSGYSELSFASIAASSFSGTQLGIKPIDTSGTNIALMNLLLTPSFTSTSANFTYKVPMSGTPTTVVKNATKVLNPFTNPPTSYGITVSSSVQDINGTWRFLSSTPTITGFPTPTCTGSLITITGYNFTGATGVTIKGVSAPGFTVVNDNTITVPVPVGSAGSGPITVTSSAGTGTSGTNILVNVTPAPPIAGSNSPVCVGGTLNLTSSAASNYTWTGPNAFSSNVQNPTLPGVTALYAGTYSVTTNLSGCVSSPGIVNVLVGPQTYVVTSTANGSIGDGVSLRWAITQANASCGHDIIKFNLGAGGPFTFNLTTPLPSLTDNLGVTLDGWDNSGNNGVPNTIPVFNTTSSTPFNPTYKIILNSASASVITAFVVASDNNIIRGFVLQSFGDGTPSSNDITIDVQGNSNSVLGCYIGLDQGGTTKGANSYTGIQVTGNNNIIGDGTPAGANLISGMNGGGWGILVMNNAAGNTIKGNQIGLQKDGATVVAGEAQNEGVGIVNNATNNTVGGTAAGEGNVLSGNDSYGIYISSTVGGNFVKGNILGTKADGNNYVTSVQSAGVLIDNSPNNLIGGNTAAARNIISGNQAYGVYISSASAIGNNIKGNYIGLNKSGTSLVAGSPQANGVYISNSASGNFIGGSTAGDGNVISGNTSQGIFLNSVGSGNTILGNIIGLQANGTSMVASNNQPDGILLLDGNNIIGGTTAGARNIISGNITNGLSLSGSNATGNIIKNNYIGPGSGGSTIPGSSQNYGINISTAVANNTIGGTAAGEANTIAFNTINGIFLISNTSIGNKISGNPIYQNTGKPISLNISANNNLASPVITTAITSTVAGTAPPNATIEIFHSPTSNNCYDAQIYLGTTIADGLGNWTYSTSLSTGDTVLATATDASNNTSEFSVCKPVTANIYYSRATGNWEDIVSVWSNNGYAGAACGCAPGLGATVNIGNGQTITKTTSSLSIDTLRIDATGILDLNTQTGLSINVFAADGLGGNGLLKISSSTFPNVPNNYFLTITGTGGSTVEYYGNTPYTLPSSLNYQNLTISGTGIKKPPVGTMTMQGDLTVNAGATLTVSNGGPFSTFNVVGNLSGLGTIDLSPGGYSHALNLSGASNSMGTFIAGSSTVTYNGAINQNVFPTNYNNLQVSGSGTVKRIQGPVTVFSNLTLNGNTSVALGLYDLTIIQGATLTTSGAPGSNRKILMNGLTTGGQLIKKINTSTDLTSITFPIGTAAGFSTLSFSSISAASFVSTQLAIKPYDTTGTNIATLNLILTPSFTSIAPTAFTYTVPMSGTPVNVTKNSVNVTNPYTNAPTSYGITASSSIQDINGTWRFLSAIPVITSFPSPVCIGTPLTITGSYFTGTTSIAINAVPAPGYTVVNDNTITVTVPAGSAGTGNISVTNAAGTGISASAITINPNNTVSAPSSTPTLCINTTLAAITHATTGATGISAPTGLPAGVTAAWASNTITISGTPTASGTFNYTIPLTGGCGVVNATGTITVNPANTASAPSSTPTLCISTTLAAITHATTGATGIGAPTGLPAGVTAAWASNTITISGTPTASGTFNYTIPLTGGCGVVNATGTITVNPANTASAPSSTPTLCINTTLAAITHATTGATGISAPTGLPAGVTAAWASNTITISGTPTASGTFNYTIPLTGGCGAINATGTITVNPANTASAPSSTPTVCMSTALTAITHTTTGATGISAPTGLPAGVTAAWASNTITISGTPTASGTFNYTIPLTGGCGAINATGTITVNPANTASAPSSTPTVCMSTALTAITHTTTGATGIGAPTGLPAGVTAAWASNTITISGTPTASGTFNYTIPLTGGCGAINATGTINVTPANTASAPSSTPTVCMSTALTPITHTTTGATGIGAPTGLPAGVTAAWASNTITISGTPTASGTFNYTIPLTGGCGVVNATGTITVSPSMFIPDANFRAWLTSNYGACMCGNNLITNCPAVLSTTTLTINSLGISDLTGILAFTSLNILTFQNNLLTAVPSLPATVTDISMDGNNISSVTVLPPNLTSLSLASNNLSSIPNILPNTLTNLYVGGNSLTALPTLPAGLGGLSCGNNLLTTLSLPPNLGVLFCNNNNISTLPTLPPNLNYLDCSFNQLTVLPTLPNTLCTLVGINNPNPSSNLCYPNIPSCPSFSADIPSCIINVTSFTPTTGCTGDSIDINGSGFTNALSVKFNGTAAGYSVKSDLLVRAAVPASATTGFISVTTSFGTGTSVTNFTPIPSVLIPDVNFRAYLTSTYPACMCGNNLITNCPAIVNETTLDLHMMGISDITGIQYFTSLTTLSLYGDNVATVANLPNTIQNLDLSFNPTTSISAFPSSMVHFKAWNNTVTNIPVIPSNVLYFDMEYNFLSNWPSSLSALPNIKYLDMEGSTFNFVPSFPASLDTLKMDACFFITSYPTLPPALKYFDVNGNSTLATCPTFPSTLVYADVSKCALPSLPAALPTGLTYLDCSINQIAVLPTLPTTLANLNCSGNQLTILPTLPNSLCTLSAINNPSPANNLCYPNTPTCGSFTADIPSCNISIATFTPGSGCIGDSIDINGTNFNGATVVNFNGTSAGFRFISNVLIRAAIPAAATNGTISITALAGTATSISSLTVNPTPSVNTIALTNVCDGVTNNVNITPTSTPSGASYTWTASTAGTATGFSAGSGSTITQTVNSGGTISTITYAVVPTLGTCIGTSQNIDVQANPIATVTPQATSTICDGATTAITPIASSAGASFSWTTSVVGGASGFSASSGNSITQLLNNTSTTASTVTYAVSAVLNGCTGTPQNIDIVVNPALSVNPVAPSTNCDGSTTSIAIASPTAGATLSWTASTTGTASGFSGGSGATPASISQTLNSGATNSLVTYAVKASLGTCTSAVQNVNVMVNIMPLPTLTISPSKDTLCSAQNATVTIGSTQTGVTYSAFDNISTPVGSPVIGNGSNQNITINFSQLIAGANEISIKATIAGCPVVNLTQTDTIYASSISTPTITSSVPSLCTNVPVVFSVFNTFNIYEWHYGTTTNFAASSQLINGGTNAETVYLPGYYFIKLFDIYGCSTITAAQYIDYGTALPVIAQTANTGIEVDLNCSNATSYYQWYVENAAGKLKYIEGANSANFKTYFDGNYYIAVKSNNCYIYSNVSTVSGMAAGSILKQGFFENDSSIVIPDISFAKDMEIFPNPSNGTFEIKYLSTSNEVSTITLFNALGAPISTKQNSERGFITIPFNESDLAVGVYYIEVVQDGNNMRKKVMIQK